MPHFVCPLCQKGDFTAWSTGENIRLDIHIEQEHSEDPAKFKPYRAVRNEREEGGETHNHSGAELLRKFFTDPFVQEIRTG